MNRATTRLAIAGLALLTAACTASGTAGTPQAATTTSSSSSVPAPPGDNENSALADLSACDLLTSEEVGRLGLTHPGEAKDVAGVDTCNWYGDGNGAASAGINTRQGIDELNYQGSHTVPTSVGKFDATRIEAPLEAKYACHVVISTSATSSVQVIGMVKANSTDTAAACDRATKAAELIAPKLP
ncbi:DUF3558 family protein [Saccharothrix saharensis]|uniref:DUF3558 family protein n=1 Tax=Saccharothrix saharensis TaxID=571190 RepID=UPI0036A05CC3